jgi:PAS domain S-box-containing protein
MLKQMMKDDRPVQAGYPSTINEALLSYFSEDETITELLSAVVAQSGSSQGWVSVFEPRSQQFIIRASIGLPICALEQFVAQRSSQRGPGLAFSLRRPILINDIETSTEFSAYLSTARSVGIRSVISTPFFTANNSPLGILSLCYQTPRTFSEGDVRMAQLGAQQLAIYAKSCHALAEGERRLSLITQNLPILTWSADPQGRVVREQPAWEVFSGMEFNEYRDYQWQTAVHPTDWPQIEEVGSNALVTGASFQIDCRLRRADGAYRFMRVHVHPWKSIEGHINEWLVACEDRTEIVQMKEQLATAASRTTRILSILAHDLRNPLSTLSLAARVIQNPATVRAQFEHFGKIIERQTRKMAQIVDDLLDVTRIAKGKLLLNKKSVAMRSVVEAAAESIHLYVRERRHTLSVNFPREPLQVFGDKSRLVQAIAALVTHAAKAMPPGGHISVNLSEGAGNIVLNVMHDGGGIVPSTLPSVFDLAGDSSDKALEGNGGQEQDLNLSLALIKSIITYHGGSISAFSEGIESGATFLITLPKMD